MGSGSAQRAKTWTAAYEETDEGGPRSSQLT